MDAMRVLVIASDIAIAASVLGKATLAAQKEFIEDVKQQLPEEVYEFVMPYDDYLEIIIPHEKQQKQQFYEHKSRHKLPAFNHKPKNELKKQAYIFLKEKEC